MIDVGRVCVKIAGRDAGLKCVIVDVLDSTYVLIDGETRRRKCNVTHLEPLDQVVDIRKGASHEEVAKAVEKFGWNVFASKTKKPSPRPRKGRKSKLAAPADASKEKPKAAGKPKAIKAQASPVQKKPVPAEKPEQEKKPVKAETPSEKKS